MDAFLSRAERAHCQAMLDFLGFLKAHAPVEHDTSEIEDMQLYVTNLVLPDDEKRRLAVETWRDSMIEPLDARDVKYGKALDRILAGDPEGAVCCGSSVFHAMAYRDLDAVIASSTSETLARLNLSVLMRDFSDSDTKAMWKYVDELSRTAFEALDVAPPRVPDREEIARNIRANRRPSGGGAITRAFSVAVHALHEALCRDLPPDGARRDRLDEEGVEQVKQQLTTALAEDEGLLARLQRREDAALRELASRVTPARLPLRAPLGASEWGLLLQALALCKVDGHVPKAVMHQVEGFAQRLANDMMSGRRDLSSLANLESMGEELMSQIDPSDMDKLTANVDQLLPMLQTLQQSLQVPGAATPPDVGGASK